MKKKLYVITVTCIIFISLLTIIAISWCNYTFGKVEINQILFTLLSSITGSDKNLTINFLIAVLLSTEIAIIVLLILKTILRRSYLRKQKIYRITSVIAKYLWIPAILLLAGTLVIVEDNFKVLNYLNQKNKKTQIYEAIGDNKNIIYVDPRNVEISGKNTNNLIYIYLESYENTFIDQANGGIKEINCLPELTTLAKENISFSNNEKLGGALAFPGTTWTIASVVSQSSGLPLKGEVANTMDKYDKFMPGAKMIGDILAKYDYVQEYFTCTRSYFAGTDKMFLQHGNYKIVDFDVLDSQGKIQEDEYCDWGAIDTALFRNAKIELNNLAKSNKKFNFTMATIDCHMPEGYLCSKCPNIYQNNYENVYACQSKQVYDFITWCKQQTWYKDTTIVLVGDHNTMATKYVANLPTDYVRTTYNCFINSKASTKNIKNREFSQLDMFPTTLNAMGFEIEGNKLSLGTNLFSKLPTAIEKYGFEYIEQEVQKSSKYLDNEIYQFEQK